MKLQDTYFKITKESGEGLSRTFDVELLNSHPVYNGHFPGMPISPGVCNIQMIKECTASVIKKKLRITDIAQCRFSATISPNETPVLQVEISIEPNENENLKVRATIKNEETVYLTFRGDMAISD